MSRSGHIRNWRVAILTTLWPFFAAASMCPWTALHAQSPDTFQTITDYFADWNIAGSNTFRAETYGVTGDESTSPYFDEGIQAFNDLYLTYSKRHSAYEQWYGSFAGVYNESEYRATEKNLIVDRVDLTWEKGDTTVPFRLQLGDFFGYSSFRTLQRSLKGAQLELQPIGGLANERHSVMLTSGFTDTNYRDIDPGKDYFNAISWLIEHDNHGRLALNAVNNFREEDTAAATPERKQTVLSLAAERSLSYFGRSAEIEGEIVHFFGDSGSGATTRQDTAENGYFFQLRDRGRSSPLTYSFRYENYGKDFLPNGAVVAANRRSIEARGGWRFDDGRRIDGRLTQFTDGLEDASSVDTSTAGFTLSGPVPGQIWPGLFGRFDTFVQETLATDRSANSVTQSATLDLSAPITDNLSGRLSVLGQSANDRTTGVDVTTRQVSISVDHTIQLYNLVGSLSPGLVARRVTGGSSETIDLGPSISFGLSGAGNTIDASYRLLVQDRGGEGTNDIVTHDFALAYSRRVGIHEIGAEFDFQNRHTNPGIDTDSYKASIFWRVNFHKPVRGDGSTAGSGQTSLDQRFEIRPTLLVPGISLKAALDELSFNGISGGVYLPGAIVYRTRVLSDTDLDQRFVVLHRHGRAQSSAVIIELGDLRDVSGIRQAFERVNEELIRKYGPPARNFRQGEFGPTFEQDVNNDRFIRIAEWDIGRNVLRYGIPRRLDGQVRIEIRYAKELPPPRQTRWSVERVR